MGLTGKLKNGIVIQAIVPCGFVGDPRPPHGDIGNCDGEPRYCVFFYDGSSLNACEEHVQRLWDAEVSSARRESSTSLAVDGGSVELPDAGVPGKAKANKNSSVGTGPETG